MDSAASIFRFASNAQHEYLHFKTHIQSRVHIYGVYTTVQYHSLIDFGYGWSILSIYLLFHDLWHSVWFLKYQSTGLNWLLDTAETELFWISV